MKPCKSLAAAALIALSGSNIPITVGAELFTHGNVKLFNGPGDRFVSRGTVAAGVPVTILWCNGAADWCMVQSGAAHGWAPMSDIMTDSHDAAPAKSGSRAGDRPASAAASPPASLAGGGTAPGASPNVSPGGSGGVDVSASAGGASLGVKLH